MSIPTGLRALVVAACLLALVGCSDLSGTGSQGYLTGDGVPREIAVADRGDPVELEGEDLEGAAVDLADLRGKPVVVNAWASWCPPCRVEQPELNEAAEELGDQVTFLGINIRDPDVAPAQAYARSYEVPYSSIHSPDGEALLPFSIPPRSIPSTIVLDAQGRIAATIMGRVPSKLTLTSIVETVLSEGGSGG